MTRILPYRTSEDRRAARAELAPHLAGGGILAYPTETVYGLGCVLRPEPLEALAAFKGGHPFLLLIRRPADAEGLAWTDDARRLTEAFWPGPLTVVLTAGEGSYPPQVVGPDGGVAVRVSPHAAIPSVLEVAEGPITSTSANAPGRPPARDGEAAARVVAGWGADVGVMVLDGGSLPMQRPSTIVRCGNTNRLIREGAIPRAELESVVALQ